MYGLTITNDIQNEYVSQYKEIFKWKAYEYGKKKIKPKKIKFLNGELPIKETDSKTASRPQSPSKSDTKTASRPQSASKNQEEVANKSEDISKNESKTEEKK